MCLDQALLYVLYIPCFRAHTRRTPALSNSGAVVVVASPRNRTRNGSRALFELTPGRYAISKLSAKVVRLPSFPGSQVIESPDRKGMYRTKALVSTMQGVVLLLMNAFHYLHTSRYGTQVTLGAKSDRIGNLLYASACQCVSFRLTPARGPLRRTHPCSAEPETWCQCTLYDCGAVLVLGNQLTPLDSPPLQLPSMRTHVLYHTRDSR